MSMLSELDTAMMQPGLSVPAIRRFGGGTIRRDTAGRPLRATGRDAVVYELDAPDGRIWALRCLQRPDASRDRILAGRYAALANDPRLAPLRGPGAPLPRDIQWIAEGIGFTGPDFHRITAPVMAMERVPGRTLLLAVDRLCHEGQREPLALLADAWLETAAALAATGFVHGDLAADNLIVRPDGSLAVVDLDTARWPTPDLPPMAAAGTPGYAHPRGAPRDPERADRFPALILWASLRILARHPHLRERWGDHPDRYGGALLWSPDDLQRPGRSPLFAALVDLRDETLAPLLEVVRRAIQFPPDETPPLAEIADRLDALGMPRRASSGPPRRTAAPPALDTSPPVSPPAMPAPRSAPAPVPTVVGIEPGPPATRTETTTRLAKERRLAAAQQLRTALDARNTVKALQLWEEHRAVPEAAPFAAAVHLLLTRDAVATIDRALRRGDDRELVAAVAEAERAGVAPSAEARVALRAARERIAARAALREAMAQGDLDALARLAATGALDCLGRLSAEEARAVARARAWPALDRALARDDDDAIVAAASSALWQDGAGLPLAARERVALARARQRWAAEVRGALRRRDNAALRALLAKAPPNAEQRLTEVESRRVLRVAVRDAAVARLEKALREGPDREIVAALTEFESAGAPFSDVLDWAAVRGVVDRVSLVEALRDAAAADPPDAALLARLLSAARAALRDRGGEPGGGPDWQALERSVLRAAHLARLREALATGDPARIAAAVAPDPYDARSLLRPEEQAHLERVLAPR
jgi:hypothetical protein